LNQLLENTPVATLSTTEVLAIVTNTAFAELSTEKLVEVFKAVPISDLTPEQEAALVATLSEAPAEVKAQFEETIDVYGSGLDDYVPNGSSVDVGTRRALIATTTVLATAAAAGAAPGASNGGSRGPSGGGNSSGPSAAEQNTAARREDEESEDEEAGGLEGPDDRDTRNYTKNSIYNYGENGVKKFSILGFIKKFAKETAGLAFTLAGSAIMFVTLSGDTRRIAVIATVAALAVHYAHVMLSNDED
jgi:hypothetical protein